ncbi:unnamed protein product [Penicillium roqueforti FM164]|uniref:Genomic scaffold, ProqFM164S01 n=1 Tax=Penicillium roqueforti (strain FM164) TaxID=1365484 RepID=W6PZ19_PENRF|nr:unnamed protein product [Penicillium roqueforti FM164]
MTANSSISRELHILKFLERQCRKGLSANYIVQLLDAFIHIGPNGTHQCLVFELLGLQLLPKAIKFIHSAGICHRGNELPAQLIKAAEWTEWIDEDDEDIRLLNFGESSYQG